MIEITKENYSPQIIIKDNPFKQLAKEMLNIQDILLMPGKLEMSGHVEMFGCVKLSDAFCRYVIYSFNMYYVCQIV